MARTVSMVLAFGVLLTGADSAQGAYWRNCKGSPAFSVRALQAHGVNCRKARNVAEQHWGTGPVGWRCEYRSRGQWRKRVCDRADSRARIRFVTL